MIHPIRAGRAEQKSSSCRTESITSWRTGAVWHCSSELHYCAEGTSVPCYLISMTITACFQMHNNPLQHPVRSFSWNVRTPEMKSVRMERWRTTSIHCVLFSHESVRNVHLTGSQLIEQLYSRFAQMMSQACTHELEVGENQKTQAEKGTWAQDQTGRRKRDLLCHCAAYIRN